MLSLLSDCSDACVSSSADWSTSTFEPAVSEVHSWVGRLRDGYDISVPGSVAGPGTVTTWLFQEQRELFHGSCGLVRVAECAEPGRVDFIAPASALKAIVAAVAGAPDLGAPGGAEIKVDFL